MHTMQTALALSALAVFTGCSDTPPSEGETTLYPNSNTPVASGTNSFDKVTAKLDKGGNLFLYYNTEDVIRSLDEFVTSLVPLFRQTLLNNQRTHSTHLRTLRLKMACAVSGLPL